MARRLSYLPILLVGTFRPHPQPTTLPRLIDTASREGASVLGEAFLDTAGHTLSGELWIEAGSLEVTVKLPAGFWARNRYVFWSGLIDHPSGTIHCPSGTEVTIDPLYPLGVTGYLC